MNILGTGLSGLVGSRIVELLKDHTFENISTSTGVDITNKEQVRRAFENSSAEWVMHLAAFADVDGCEKDKEKAQAVNVLGTKNIVDICKQFEKKLIYISTDFVFSGEDQPSEGYTEESNPSPINYYGQTKYEGEQVVQKSDISWVIARIAYPYRSAFGKKDFVRAVLSRLQNGDQVTMVTDHVMVPTFIDDIASALGALMENNATGIYHVVGSSPVTPYDAAVMIAKTFDIQNPEISQTTRAEFFKDRAQRPFQLYLRNDKIKKLGVQMSTFEEGLHKILNQVQDDKKI